MSRIRAVFVDAGNTLFAERTARAAIYADVARRNGIAVDETRVATAMKEVHAVLPQRVGRGFRYSRTWFERFIAEVFKKVGHPTLPTAVPAELFARFARPDTFRLFPDVMAALEGLTRRGLKLAVVSNWSPNLASLLEELGLARHFEGVIVSSLEELEKPDPAIFRRALGVLSVGADEAVHVGDETARDIAGARAAGLHAVLLDRDNHLPEFAGPRILTLTDLGAAIDRIETDHRSESELFKLRKLRETARAPALATFRKAR